mmetsp:Transcript_23917/g.68429  ORF Transcript_23917/g.68429 Transcript_23917/m.68429 type:complete len:224 (+) Transcript_23917:261-932(+)
MMAVDSTARRANQMAVSTSGQARCSSSSSPACAGVGAGVGPPLAGTAAAGVTDLPLAFRGSSGFSAGPWPGQPTTSNASTGDGLHVAKSTVVRPSAVRRKLSPPAHRSARRTYFDPWCAARCNGVTPLASPTFTSARRAQRCLTSCSCSPAAGAESAQCKAVRPLSSSGSHVQASASSGETAPSMSRTLLSDPLRRSAVKSSVSSCTKRGDSSRRTARRGILP